MNLQVLRKNLIENATLSELKIKEYLESKSINFKFQEILEEIFIADFFFPERRLIVELDGKFHNLEKDKKRDLFFKSRGYKTLRIKSKYVFVDFNWVIEAINGALNGFSPRKLKKRKAKNYKIYKDDYSDFMFFTKGI